MYILYNSITYLIDTSRTVSAREGVAFIYFFLTKFSCISRDATTMVEIYSINASCINRAIVLCTIINVHLALVSCKPGWALTAKTVNKISTCPIVTTWLTNTFVNVNATGFSGITWKTVAFEVIYSVKARCHVYARSFSTIIDVRFTFESCKTGAAFTVKCADTIKASSTILAWVSLALVNVNFTVGTTESLDAMALILVNPV